MATSNFHSMEDFPLIVMMEEKTKVCPECHLGQDPANEKCEVCGCDLTATEEIVDDFWCEENIREMEKYAESINERQPFFKVSVKSGYYEGAQFFVERVNEPAEEMTNEDTRYYYDLCRSAAIRKENTACNLVRRELRKATKKLGCIELAVTARFSNGETWYSKVA